MVRTRSATWRMRSSGRLPSIEARCSSQAFASRRSESDIEVPFRAGHCAGPVTTAKVDGGTPFSPHTLKSMSSDIIDANGSLHASDNGRFTGHVQAEGDTAVIDIDEALVGQPFLVTVQLEEWDRNHTFPVNSVEFDAAPLLLGADQALRDQLEEKYGQEDWLFEEAVARGIVEPWGGPFTVRYEKDELFDWFEANPIDHTPRLSDLKIADMAAFAGVDVPEPGSAGAAYLIAAREAALEIAARDEVTEQSITNAVGLLAAGDEDDRWQAFTSLRLYDRRHDLTTEAFSGLHNVMATRMNRAAESVILRSLDHAGIKVVEPAPQPASEAPKEPQVVDLVAALRESMEAAKRRRLEAAGEATKS